MPAKPPPTQVTLIEGVAVVTFPETDWLLRSIDPVRDGGQALYDLVGRDHHSTVILDFSLQDISWISCAFESILIGLHRRLSQANGALKLCNVPEAIMAQFRMNHLIKVFQIYPDLEAALGVKSSDR